MKKLFTMIVSVALLATMVVGGTLAQGMMTEDEFIKQTNHKIGVQIVQGNNIETPEQIKITEIVPGYTENSIGLMNPAENNITTYNRLLIAVPVSWDDVVDLVVNEDVVLDSTKIITNQTCDGIVSNIYVYTLKDSLSVGEQVFPIKGVDITTDLKQAGNYYVLNGTTYDFSEELKISIKAQAVQVNYLENAQIAFQAASLPDNPWAEALYVNQPVDKAVLKSALCMLPTGTDISKTITDVEFGNRNDSKYSDIVTSCYGRPLNDEDPNGAWVYYQAHEVDGTTTWSVYILSDDIIYLPEDCQELFKGMTALTRVDAINLDTSHVTNMHSMFMNCSKLTFVDVSTWDVSKVTDMSQMFYKCSSLDNLDVSNWDTSRVKNMSQMFNSCSSLTSLDTDEWDMSNVTGSFNYMFHGCKELTAVDVDGWVTSDTKSISFMFCGCNKLTAIDVSKWDTSNVTAMDNAFNSCSSVEVLDVSNWNTSKVTTTWQMFQNCSKLTSLNLNRWDTANVKNMANMFCNCSRLTTLDIASFDVKKVEKIENMFNGCSKLTTILVSNVAGWDNLATNHANEVVFASCSNLVGGAGTAFKGQEGMYAKIDGGASSPGYFTLKENANE